MRASDALRRARPRQFDLRRIVTHDFPMKAIAVVIAVVFAVANAQNAAPREIVVQFDGRVPVERPDIPAGFVLRGQLGDVSVSLRGPEGVVDRMALADLHATLDLAGVDAGSTEPHDAKVVVTVSNEAVKVVDVTPPTVSVRLERVTSRTLAVQTKLANDPPKGLQAAQTSVSPKEVRIVGPESAVAQVAAVFATVRFGDVTTDLTQSAPAIPVDANGLAVDGLQVEPGVVVVSVPLLPIATTRTLPVLWSLHGSVANGYWVSEVTTDPAVVTLKGDQSVLAKVERVETAPIDLTGLNASKTFNIALVLPNGATLLRPTDVSVTVTIVPLAGTRPFLEAVQVASLGSAWIAETDPGSVMVTVAGPAPALLAMTADLVSVSVDASGLGPGVYSVPVTVRAPTGITVQGVQPLRVTLTIRNK